MLYINRNKLEHMLKLITHTEVVDTIVRVVDTNLFTVHRNDKEGWTAIVSKDERIKPSLCVHTDTVNNIHPKSILKVGDVWRNGDYTKLLGADDRAGCYIVKELLTRNNTDYNYLIFDQEEVGCIGSSNFAKTSESEVIADLTSCFVGLDRMGVLEHALYGYENDDFMVAIADEADDWKEEMGSITDASSLAGDLDRCCVNLSVGYNNEHTRFETLNLSYLGITLNRLNNGLSNLLYEFHFIPDYNYNSYNMNGSWGDEYYDEYKWDDDKGAYVKWDAEDDLCATPVSEDDDENTLPWCKDDDFLRKGA